MKGLWIRLCSFPWSLEVWVKHASIWRQNSGKTHSTYHDDKEVFLSFHLNRTLLNKWHKGRIHHLKEKWYLNGLHWTSCVHLVLIVYSDSFSIRVFFHNHSRNTGLQGMVEGICLTPHHHFQPLHSRLDISRAITAESSPMHIGSSSRTRTGNLWFQSASC